jgi:DNA-binding NtrC family response regulator
MAINIPTLNNTSVATKLVSFAAPTNKNRECILVVDDSLRVRKVFVKCLSNRFQSVVAASVSEAVGFLNLFEPSEMDVLELTVERPLERQNLFVL